MNCQSRLASTTPAKFGSLSISFSARSVLILLPAMSSGALRTKNGMSTAAPIWRKCSSTIAGGGVQ